MRRLTYAAALLLAAAAPAGAMAADAPTAPLHYGEASPQVLLLQRELNQASSTQVAIAGPGSPGHETSYFGPLTLSAVKRFQAKHASEVLAPIGLTAPTGFVGPMTLAELARLNAATSTAQAPHASASASGAGQQTAATSTAPTTPAAEAAAGAATSTAASSTLNAFIRTMRTVGAQQGYTAAQLNQAEAIIRQVAATTTDYTAQFYKEQRALYEKKQSFLEKAWGKLAAFVAPQLAQASVGLPFGGYVAYASPVCTCPGAFSMLLYITLPALTPTSNLFLSYIPGTEAFDWHNLPAMGLATLGEYNPAIHTCAWYTGHMCVPIPTEGQVLPLVGSSLTPSI